MATFPPLPQIVGQHGGIYEAYYLQADPMGTGSIGALDAATFLKKSKLKDTTLSQIWDLSDPVGKGYLEKTGFYVALKLISLIQNSQDLSIAKLTLDTPAPDLGPVEPIDLSTSSGAGAMDAPWDIPMSEKSKYDTVFDSLQPVNNTLGGDKVKPVLMNSTLPVDILGRIWDLSDIDKDGSLDRDEFAVAMHLVYQAREGQETPSILKPSLIPPSKRKSAGSSSSSVPMPGAIPVLPTGAALGRATPPVTVGAVWVVTPVDKASSDSTFSKLDLDGDGLVSGVEMKDILTQSGLANNVLAHIWGLCDYQNVGKLTSEQFALAMYLIQQKLKGVDPPSQLTSEMVPPSQRNMADPGTFGVREGPNAGPHGQSVDQSAMKELDQISREIEDIKRERLQLERDKAQREADLKIRHSEVLLLQKELDSLNNTVTQLDGQKREAQKRLDELEDKRSNLERNVKEMREKTNTEQMEVNKMKSLLSNRDQMIKDQEQELTKLRTELTELHEEESRLEQTVDSGKQQLQMLAKSQSDIDAEILQTKSRINQLKEQYKNVDNGSVTMDLSTSSFDAGAGVAQATAFAMDGFTEDPFKGQDPFGGQGASALSTLPADPFQSDDPFKDSDPFKSSDPFGNQDPFQDAFGSNNTTQPDPFGGVAAPSQPAKIDNNSFDAFGSSWGKSKTATSSPKPPSDPFANLHAPTRPAQPAKSKKAPPPRPAPPKSKSPLPFSSNPAKPKVDPFAAFGDSDPFSGKTTNKSSTSNNSDPFANFADFSPGKFDDSSSAWAT